MRHAPGPHFLDLETSPETRQARISRRLIPPGCLVQWDPRRQWTIGEPARALSTGPRGHGRGLNALLNSPPLCMGALMLLCGVLGAALYLFPASLTLVLR